MRVWAAATYLMRLGGPMSQPWGDVSEAVPGALAREEKHTDSPTRGVKVLARGTNSKSELLNLGGQRCDAREGHVVQPVIHLVREDEDLVLHAQVADALELFAGVDLAQGVILSLC